MSIKVRKYSAPPSDFEFIFPQMSLWTSPRGSSAQLLAVLGLVVFSFSAFLTKFNISGYNHTADHRLAFFELTFGVQTFDAKVSEIVSNLSN